MTETAEDIAEALKLWTAAEVLAVLDRQGWPEWVGHDGRHRLAREADGWRVSIWSEVWQGWAAAFIQPNGDMFALAVLRDDSRQRLAAAGIVIREEPSLSGRYQVLRPPKDSGVLQIAVMDDVAMVDLAYDAALIAGRRAIE